MTSPAQGHSGASSEEFVILDWDSAHFGFPVARINSSVAFWSLDGIAERMRNHGIVLAYFNVGTRVPSISDEALSRLGGRLVDQRVTYTARLTSDDWANLEPELDHDHFHIAEYRSVEVASSLRRLALESGAFSRFRLDPQIPQGVFEAIYDAWIRRSVAREIADEVLTANEDDRIIGFVTVRAGGPLGEIGLLAVDASARGRGVGLSLVRAAHSAMLRHGCTQARVATQKDNLGACAVYQSAGYVVSEVERVYHFWLLLPGRLGTT